MANNILSAWILVEEISGGEIDKNAKWLTDKEMVVIQQTRDNEKTTKPGKDSVVYLGEYRKQEMRDEIQKEVFDDFVPVQNIDFAKGYSVALTVDEQGYFGRVFVPYAAYFYLQLRLGDRQEATQRDGYNDFCDKLGQEIKEIIDDNQLTFQTALHKANNFVNKVFRMGDKATNDIRGFLNYTKEPALLNSFYVDDLKKIRDEKTDDPMLMSYLQQKANQHIGIDQKWSFISSLLSVDKLPDGRWPSQVEFFQSLMQQVVVNVLRDKAAQKSDLRTVNGPPGTGKTTLLKDVFADMVVKQAKVMVNLDHPAEGFKKIGKVTLYSKYSYKTYELIPELQGFGIVVTSNNNAAVANIATDFPAKSEIQQHSDKSAENEYINELAKVDYFSAAANHILAPSPSWWLFAVPMGSRGNQKKVFDYFNGRDEENQQKRLKSMLGSDLQPEDWEEAQTCFNEALSEVHRIKSELITAIKTVKKFDVSELKQVQQELATLDIEAKQHILTEISAKIADQESALKLLKPKRVLLFIKKETPEQIELKTELSKSFAQRGHAREVLTQAQEQATRLRKRLKKLQQLAAQMQPIREKLARDQTHVITDDYWQQPNDLLQIQLPNNSLALQDARAKLFIAAMRLRKAFACGASSQISNAWAVFENQNKLPYPTNTHNLVAAFQIMQVLIPVMSTTLASVKTMFANFPENSIDNVFIDEAGQATPASAVGIMWRAKKLVAVGDPAQVEPVVTTDEPTLRMIADEYGIEPKYTLPTISVQQLADEASVYGMQKSPKEWVGMPLWVHRRCASPMFEIANEISYNNKMVQGNPETTVNLRSGWINSIGPTSDQQFVQQQVKDLATEIKRCLKSDVTLNDIFVVSPFKAVVRNIKQQIAAALMMKEVKADKQWCDANIGTVHTFQGKEAKVVFFVVGTDKETDGAANWAFEKPNLLNVAVTRAKTAFYVVGDYERLKQKPFISVAAEKLK